jgi:NAD(P)-dependent dehydrogenase (short-subunit alcohol dehydrogenase family)
LETASGLDQREEMAMQLEGKTALVAGGAGGIGRATAVLFAREGAAVCIVDRNRELGEKVAHEISSIGGVRFSSVAM